MGTLGPANARSEEGPAGKPVVALPSTGGMAALGAVPASLPDAGGTVPVETGARFGKYRLVRRLGAGGMGIVYEAVDETLGRRVALKVLKSGGAGAGLAERLVREGRVLASLAHPGIARVYEVGIEGAGIVKVPYLAMELVEGPDLGSWIAERTPGLASRLEVMIAICRAVQHAHDRGVLHRDLKPANILIGGAGAPKVVDFGVAKVLGGEDAAQTMPGQVVGTLQYLAPEQAVPGGRLSPQTDVYALGLIAYEVLCGTVPYRVGAEPVSAARAIGEHRPAPVPGRVRAELGRSAAAVLETALAKAPSDRYASAGALADELTRLAGGMPVLARRCPAPVRWVHAAGRRLGRFTAIACLGAAAVGMSLGTGLAGTVQERVWGTAYERWVTTRLNHVPDALRHVSIITVTDRCDIGWMARDRGLPEVTPAVPASMRPVYGALLEHLTGSGARAVVLDAHFPPYRGARASAYDGALRRGFASLESAGVPVACVLTLPAAGAPVIAGGPGESEAPRFQSLARLAPDGPWSLFLHLRPRRGGEYPALIAAAAGGYWFGSTAIALEARGDGAVSLIGPAGQTRLTHATSVFHATADASAGLAAGDEVTEWMLEMPPRAVLDARSVDLGTVLGAEAGWLRARFAGTVVVIGDARVGRDGPYRHPSGASYHGFHAVAVGIEMLVRDLPLRQPRMLGIPMTGILVDADRLLGVGVGLGALAAWPLLSRGRGRRRSAWLGAAGGVALTVTLCLAAYRVGGVLIPPFVPVASLLGAFVCLVLVRWVIPEPVPVDR